MPVIAFEINRASFVKFVSRRIGRGRGKL